MTTTDPNATEPNTPTVDELQASVDRLTEALRKERDEHKAAKAQLTALGDVEATITERTASIAAERDEARAEADKIKAQWTDEKISTALESAFSRSGAAEQNAADFMALARPLFTVADDGRIVTRDGAPNTVPGMTPDQWIVSQLRQARAHWWPLSTGGGAKGSPTTTTTPLGNDACFDPRSPQFNVTNQFQYEARFGKAAADAALKKYGRGAR